MADEKISAMPEATDISQSDFFPMLQAGVNKKCTKGNFLSQPPGEDLALNGRLGERIYISDAGNGIGMSQPIGSGLFLAGDASLTLGNAAGRFQLSSDGVAVVVGPDASALLIDSLGALNFISTPGVYNMSNLPTSDPHVSGQLYNLSGVLMVSSG